MGKFDNGLHSLYQCKHGVVVRQCRCPSNDKRVVVVPCPDSCEEI